MKPSVPPKLPLKNAIDPMVFYKQLITASTNVGKYEVMLKKSKVREDILITPLSLQEAFQSTKIEGTQVTFDEVLEYDIDDGNKNNEAREVINYYEALYHARDALSQLPISTRLLKRLHRILLSGGVRGESRAPGEFRSIQNYIGPEGCSIENASFVPPEPQKIDEYMSNLEQYINEPEDDLHPLVRVAVIHAQFETIHPFLDGNGRIGRILIPLYLYDVDLLEFPNLFISETLEKDKHKYYRHLNDTRYQESWNEWIKFFLEAVSRQTVENMHTIEELDNLYERDLERAKELINSDRLIDLLRSMFIKPIFDVKTISSLAEIPDSTCRRYLTILEDEGIIYSDNRTRNRKYYYYSLLDLLR